MISIRRVAGFVAVALAAGIAPAHSLRVTSQPNSKFLAAAESETPGDDVQVYSNDVTDVPEREESQKTHSDKPSRRARFLDFTALAGIQKYPKCLAFGLTFLAFVSAIVMLCTYCGFGKGCWRKIVAFSVSCFVFCFSVALLIGLACDHSG